MAQPRDDRQALGLGTSDTATLERTYVGKRRAAVSTPVSTPAAPYVGKRRATGANPPARILQVPAGIPLPRVEVSQGATAAPLLHDTGEIARVLGALEPVDHTTSFAGEDTVVLPLTFAAPTVHPGAGRRRAARPVRTLTRGGLLAKAPSVPVLVGVAVLAVSVGGVVSTHSPDLAAAGPSRLGSIGALSGSDASGAVRPGVLSRDSGRAALGDASGMDLEDAVEAQAAQRNVALDQLAKKAEARAGVLAENRWVLPLAGYRLTAGFGEYGMWSSYHTGLDFAAPSGTPLLAMARGVITSTGYDGAYGNKTVLTLEDGTELWYCHQTSIYASVGEAVAAGDVIGTVGSTGNSTGSHLHLEVRPGGGDPVDPRAALAANGIAP